MKSINAFLLIMLIYAANSDLEGFDVQNCLDYTPSFFTGSSTHNPAFSLDFCRSTYYNTNTYAQCCFIKWKDSNNVKYYNCYPVTSTHLYYDIDPLVDTIKSQVSELDSLDCSSSYLYGSLLLIAVLLF